MHPFNTNTFDHLDHLDHLLLNYNTRVNKGFIGKVDNRWSEVVKVVKVVTVKFYMFRICEVL